MKLPRDLTGAELAKALQRSGYSIERQTGSHIRLKSTAHGSEHKITVPSHNPIKIGTLNAILSEVADYASINKAQLLELLFG